MPRATGSLSDSEALCKTLDETIALPSLLKLPGSTTARWKLKLIPNYYSHHCGSPSSTSRLT
jgi:hypothetical protein